MIITNNKRHTTRPGVSAVEFGMLAMLLTTFFIAIIEFGRLMMVQNLLVTAAYEGARNAILQGSTPTTVQNTITTFINSSGISSSAAGTASSGGWYYSVSPSPSASTIVPGVTAMTVTVSVPFSVVSLTNATTPFIPAALYSTTISSTIVMIHE